MKRFRTTIIAIIIISILFCQTIFIEAFANNLTAIIEKEIIITERKTENSEQFLWDTLSLYFNNEKIIAGIMGYYLRESYYDSNAIAGLWTYKQETEKQLSLNFLQKIDSGLLDGTTKEDFIYYIHYIHGGYGLGQWCTIETLESFYDFAQNWGTSIADAEMQCAFTAYTIQNHPTQIWEIIKNEENIGQIGRYIGIFYDGTEWGAETIATYAKQIYEKYGTE